MRGDRFGEAGCLRTVDLAHAAGTGQDGVRRCRERRNRAPMRLRTTAFFPRHRGSSRPYRRSGAPAPCVPSVRCATDSGPSRGREREEVAHEVYGMYARARRRRTCGRGIDEVQNRVLRCLRVRTRSAPCERQVLEDRRRRNRDCEEFGGRVRNHFGWRTRLFEEGDRPLSAVEGSGGDCGERLRAVFGVGAGRRPCIGMPDNYLLGDTASSVGAALH